MFQHDQKPYEFIFSASSATEERSWKTEILKTSVMPPNEVPTISLEPRRFSFICIPLKPLESDGRSLLLKRRGSLRTLSLRSGLRKQQDLVIIKKTHNPLHDNEVRLLHEAELTRSRSVVKRPVCTPTVLMPPRSHRVKLERSIADIFSQDILPYPGMTLGRSDYLQSQTMIRKSVIRGLSLRGVFTSRRSVSLGKVTSVFTDSDLNHGEQDKEAKEPKVTGTKNDAPETASEKKDHIEEDSEDIKPKTTKTAFNSIRQKMSRTASNNVIDESSDIKPKNKPPISWKRWLSPLSVFGFFDTTNQ